MNTTLWIAQVLLFLTFLYSGFYKSHKPTRELVAMGQTGVEGMAQPFVRFIGITELLGAVGIILPWWLQIAPVLTPVTAVGFAVVMVFAAIIHLRRKEYRAVGANVIIFSLALLVAVKRFSQI